MAINRYVLSYELFHFQILQHGNFYLFAHPRLKKRSLHENAQHHGKLTSHENV